MYLVAGSLKVADSLFHSNIAIVGGGVAYVEGPHAFFSFTNSEFRNNSAPFGAVLQSSLGE